MTTAKYKSIHKVTMHYCATTLHWCAVGLWAFERIQTKWLSVSRGTEKCRKRRHKRSAPNGHLHLHPPPQAQIHRENDLKRLYETRPRPSGACGRVYTTQSASEAGSFGVAERGGLTSVVGQGTEMGSTVNVGSCVRLVYLSGTPTRPRTCPAPSRTTMRSSPRLGAPSTPAPDLASAETYPAIEDAMKSSQSANASYIRSRSSASIGPWVASAAEPGAGGRAWPSRASVPPIACTNLSLCSRLSRSTLGKKARNSCGSCCSPTRDTARTTGYGVLSPHSRSRRSRA
mmetsp:Transcript_41610/g.97361  ORF Transcript_41610/g.97361 Transcript_41610/m.97361 type:complete len:287 (+) Transcript_41610:79-939(+)